MSCNFKLALLKDWFLEEVLSPTLSKPKKTIEKAIADKVASYLCLQTLSKTAVIFPTGRVILVTWYPVVSLPEVVWLVMPC
jgi:hypothetical protein